MAETPTIKLPKSVRGFAMLTHRGRVRRTNQDACAALLESGAYVVCDGIGGATAGEVASQLAADAFLHALSQPVSRATRRTSSKIASEVQRVAGRVQTAGQIANEDGPADHARARLCEAVRAANQAVFRHSRKSQGLRGMGTTLVGAVWDDSDATMLWLAHVGDSRCYRLRDGVLQPLTEDHSLVEEQVRAGTLSRVEAAVSPIRNIITRALGSEAAVEPEIAAHATQSGDVYLLATDGLTRELDDAEIGRILSRSLAGANAGTTQNGFGEGALEAVCQALIDAANVQGGRDNITVLLITCS